MPYIKQEDRARVDIDGMARGPGELNYQISELVDVYILDHMNRGGKVNYELMNQIAGAMHLAAAEFERRFVFPYEDQKIKENGDVYTFHEVKK